MVYSAIFCPQEEYSDCTLVCRQGKPYPAHRAVLAMASPFFSAIFRSTVYNQAATYHIVLDGVEPDHMEALLQYMYFGYSIVKCDRLPSLCKTAKALGIKEFPTLEIADPKTVHDSETAEITQFTKYEQSGRTKISRPISNISTEFIGNKKRKLSPERRSTISHFTDKTGFPQTQRVFTPRDFKTIEEDGTMYFKSPSKSLTETNDLKRHGLRSENIVSK